MGAGGSRPKIGTGVRHAPDPNQTVNADLCFVPATHPLTEALPAVSGSSGRLIVTPPKPAEAERTWPGQTFAVVGQSYVAAMDQFVAARRAVAAAQSVAAAPDPTGDADGRAARRARRADEDRLRIARDTERERRRVSDAAWKERQADHQKTREREDRDRSRAARHAHTRAVWAGRHQELARRRDADVHWREARAQVREKKGVVGIRPAQSWIAVLVLVDNCTRVCLGLPLFTVGAHVTAELVAGALQALLPRELAYLITDGGAHFTADVIQNLARERGFVRVPLAKHRPQSNGIAERFIETLKAWLADQPWETADDLATLLTQFRADYNDRPHQGRELAGLSPNEYTARKLVA